MRKFFSNLIAAGFIVLMALALLSGISVLLGYEKPENIEGGEHHLFTGYAYGNWGAVPAGGIEIIGWAGLQYLPELEETEVGFLLDRPYWGRGYATEAGLASIKYGFEHFNFDHIIALVHPDNLASQRVIEKCGMCYVETLTLWGIELHCFRIENPLRE